MFNKTVLWAVGCLMVLAAAGSANALPTKEITVSMLPYD
jgi:hypothetical protein